MLVCALPPVLGVRVTVRSICDQGSSLCNPTRRPYLDTSVISNNAYFSARAHANMVLSHFTIIPPRNDGVVGENHVVRVCTLVGYALLHMTGGSTDVAHVRLHGSTFAFAACRSTAHPNLPPAAVASPGKPWYCKGNDPHIHMYQTRSYTPHLAPYNHYRLL